MIATRWVISQSITSFTKNKNPDTGEIHQLGLTYFAYTDQQYLFKKYCLINDLILE